MTKPVMRDTEAAEYLGVCRSTLWNLVAQNAFPRVFVGGCSRFRRSDIDAYLDRQTVTADEAANRRHRAPRGRPVRPAGLTTAA